MTKTNDKSRTANAEEAPPPFGGSWTILYAIVLITLCALVLSFYLFTRALR